MRRSTTTLLAISLIWGSTWIPNQYLADQGTPCALAALRYALAALILAAAALPRKHRSHPALLPGLVLGVTMLAIPVLLMTVTARHGAGAWTPLLYAALPLGLTLAEGELQFPAVAAIGAMFLFLNGSLPLTPEKILWTLPTAAAVALQGWSLLYARKHLCAASEPRCITLQLATAATLLTAASLVTEATPRVTPSWSFSTLLALTTLAALATAAAYPLYYRLLDRLAPAQLSTSQWLQTLVSAAEGACLLHQRPGWTILASAAILAACTWALLRTDSPTAPDDTFRL